ncbi:MAG: leucine-rich repeat domain-containing protein [Mycoplasmoidaceae bacterium]|nr:leucine-rich repeat domain-containing protein [Mycoplasmoidaceae bacterium]
MLGERCFANNISLQGSVELNDFIVEIPATCFFGCTSLIGVIFHSYPTSIGVAAFADCFLLTKIVVLKKDRIVYD